MGQFTSYEPFTRHVPVIGDVSISVNFVWAYAKSGSSFWHNKGNGSAAVVGGTLLYIDVIEPSKTTIKVDLPELNVQLKADSDAWMYRALSKAMIPLVRESLQLFGGQL